MHIQSLVAPLLASVSLAACSSAWKPPEIKYDDTPRQAVLQAELSRAELKMTDIVAWIMHAGGRDVLQALRERMGLSVDDLRYSAAILDEYGNMSSAFVYFVLKAALEDDAPPGWWWMSAFGAGFTCQGALLAVSARE